MFYYITFDYNCSYVFRPNCRAIFTLIFVHVEVTNDNAFNLRDHVLQDFFFVFGAAAPLEGHVLLIHEVSRSHTTTHHSRWDCSGRVISSSQRPLPDKRQHSQQTNIHDPGGIRTHDPSRRAAADLHLSQELLK
jgi:hypothetical protein